MNSIQFTRSADLVLGENVGAAAGQRIPISLLASGDGMAGDGLAAGKTGTELLTGAT